MRFISLRRDKTALKDVNIVGMFATVLECFIHVSLHIMLLLIQNTETNQSFFL